MRHQPLGRSETEFAVADLIRDPAQIRLLRVLDDDEIMPRAFLISKEEILAMRRVDVGPVLDGFFDGRDGRMFFARERNAEFS